MTPVNTLAPETALPLETPAVNGHCSTLPPGPESWSPWEAVSAQLVGENLAYFLSCEQELLRQHPDWHGQCIAIASRTRSKVLAVHAESETARRLAVATPELQALAVQQHLPPGLYVTTHFLGDVYFDA
jgi:hypothetical protein